MSDLRELGRDLLADGNAERALAVFAEAVRRQPADHRARMLAARCYAKLGEVERAVSVLHACAEGLLRRGYLLSAMAACRQALGYAPGEKRVVDTLERIHARAARIAGGKAAVPPPMPPESIYDGQVTADLMSLNGSELADTAIAVLAAPDPGASADPEARPPLPLFADLERPAFVALVSLMQYRELREGEAIVSEGQPADHIVVLVAGKSEVSRQVEGAHKTIAFLSGGSILGDISLLTGSPATSTVTCATDCEVLEVTRESLNQLARTHPGVPQVLATFAQQRMAKNLIATSPIFGFVKEAERPQLLSRFRFQALQPGDCTMREGEPVTGLSLVLAGELIVQKEDPAGGQVSLGILREGDVAGEIALLKGLRATATVQATRKTAVAVLDRPQFEALLREYPSIRAFLDGLSDRRLKQIGEALRPVEILDADELVVDQS